MNGKSVQVVCVAVGQRYPDLYVERLASMLRRYMPVPFQLTCLTDRPRPLDSTIEQRTLLERRLARPNMRPTTHKLALFDRNFLPFHEFLYLDTSLVIHKDMGPLLEFAFGSPADLVIRRDWTYDCYNSCVMRIRHSDAMQDIYSAFVEGREYPHRNSGDQDFIHAAVRDYGHQERVDLLPEEMIASYHDCKRIARTNRARAYKEIEEAIVVKFYGRQKMHLLVKPTYRAVKVMLRRPHFAFNDGVFWIRELRQRWM